MKQSSLQVGDIDLRKKIIPCDRPIFVGHETPWISPVCRFPKHFFEDFKYLASLYGVKVELGVWTKESGSGSFLGSRRGSRIWINLRHNGCYVSVEKVSHCFSHELAHTIQYKACIKTSYQQSKLMSEIVANERQAERLAYFIHKIYFDNYISAHHSEFSAYRSKSHLKFLWNFYKVYGDIVDDIGVSLPFAKTVAEYR